jgi:Domain of unknown function (DUF6883)
MQASTRFDPRHEDGRHKARVFQSVLGITAADWRYLNEAILAGVRDAPTSAIVPTPGGREARGHAGPLRMREANEPRRYARPGFPKRCPVRDSNPPHRIKSPALYQMS